MSNPNFVPNYSTDEIYRGLDMDRCLSDDLDALETGKAPMEHSHSGYAPAEHTHSGYAAENHAHDGYAAAQHSHTEYAPASHGHDGYASSSHEHTGYAPTNHTHTGFAAESHEHTGYAATNHEHTGYAAADHSHMGYSGDSASTYKLVYVGPAGSDDNAGTQAAPMATIKGAIRKYAETSKYLDIRLLDGTYNEDIGAIGTDVANLSIRSASENKDAVTINMANQLDLNSGTVRLYNMTLNVTETGVRGISVNAGALYAYNLRINVPAASTISCVNVYNGCMAFLMQCILNAGTASNAGAAVYGNQALLIKAIGCTSERKVNVGFHAHNGTDIWYTDTITATTKTKETYYGKCVAR